MTRSLRLSPLLLPAPFLRIGDADKDVLLAAGRVVKYSKGELIAREGESQECVLFTHTGFFSIELQGRVVGLEGPGFIITPGILPKETFKVSFRALSPMDFVAFDRAILMDVLLRNPSLSVFYLNLTIQQYQSTFETLYLTGELPLENRLASVLWKTGTPLTDGCRRINPYLRQAVLASFLHTTREEVGKRRKLLIASGHIFQRDKDWLLSPATPLLAHVF